MNNSNTVNQHEFWIEFIELYKTKPVLWKCGSEVYKDRKGKKRAYLDLVEKMREVEPKATVDMVKRKINSLRSCYRRKWYKAQEDIKLGIEPSVKWVYFDHFNFLRESKDSLEEEHDWSYCEDSRFTRLDDSSAQADVDENDSIVEYVSQKSSSHHGYDLASSPLSSRHEFRDDSFNQTNKFIDQDDIALKITAQHKFWTEFIKLYKSKPELWKYGTELYKDRDAKKVAYIDLVEKLREIEPNATVELVKRKINSLRSMYRRKLNNKKRAIRLGKETENKWVYFDHFSFLHECKNPLEGEDDWNHMEDSRYAKLYSIGNNTERNDVVESDLVEIDVLPAKISKNFAIDTSSPSPKRIRIESTEVSCKQLKQSNDEADILGISWAYQYRSLSQTQKLFAKKAIDDILFEGRLETLHRNSVKINMSSCDKCKSS